MVSVTRPGVLVLTLVNRYLLDSSLTVDTSFLAREMKPLRGGEPTKRLSLPLSLPAD